MYFYYVKAFIQVGRLLHDLENIVVWYPRSLEVGVCRKEREHKCLCLELGI